MSVASEQAATPNKAVPGQVFWLVRGRSGHGRPGRTTCNGGNTACGKETGMTSKYLTIPVVAGALGMSGVVVARAAEPTTSELMAQIQSLQAKVQTMEAQQQKLNAKDVDATVDSVLKDAEKRSKMLQMEGFTAGWSD